MIKEDRDFIISELKCFFKSIRRIFKYKNNDKEYSTKKILVGGGYGYGNTGDEAQCNATLKILQERYPDYQVINLTPRVEYSKREHPNFVHDFASRTMFFNNCRELDIYNFDTSSMKKVLFLLRSILIYFNALLVRADLPTFFVNARISKILYELKECSLFYFCGGGYLTGRTLSRLWDGILICRLAYLFKVPVVMSGQTIGLWNNAFNEKFAKWGFKHVNLITVRDEDFSLNDLEKIGLKGENYFATHDDALHCEKSNEKLINIENYVTLNFHYWGMKEEKERALYLDKIHSIINCILEKNNINIVFIPMHITDKNAYEDYIKIYPNNRISCFDYDYDFRKVRKVIADSYACITMKHHPIIFSMGEDVPALSLAYSNYYVHKNVGALTQYGLADFSVNLESDSYLDIFKALYNKILSDRENIKKQIISHKNILDERKEKFLSKVDFILGEESYNG